jgi:hypothetical protein
MLQAAPSQRRATCYLAVLAVALIVTIIGLSALATGRIEFRSAESANDVVAARVYAQAAMEMGLFTMSNDASWRTSYTNDVWVPAQPIGQGTYSWKLIDEENGDLTADPNAPLRLYGRGIAGDAVRTYSVLLQPDAAAGNLLANPGIENGTTGWTGTSCTLEAHTDQPHSGAAYLWVKNRAGEWDGPRQDVSSNLVNGTTYTTDVWVRMKDYPDQARIVFWMDTSLGYYSNYLTSATVGTTWTNVSTTATLTWSGTLNAAYWEVETQSSSQEFMIDDATLRVAGRSAPAALPILGTLQRVVH